jgi:hypothetical protein
MHPAKGRFNVLVTHHLDPLAEPHLAQDLTPHAQAQARFPAHIVPSNLLHHAECRVDTRNMPVWPHRRSLNRFAVLDNVERFLRRGVAVFANGACDFVEAWTVRIVVP